MWVCIFMYSVLAVGFPSNKIQIVLKKISRAKHGSNTNIQETPRSNVKRMRVSTRESAGNFEYKGVRFMQSHR